MKSLRPWSYRHYLRVWSLCLLSSGLVGVPVQKPFYVQQLQIQIYFNIMSHSNFSPEHCINFCLSILLQESHKKSNINDDHIFTGNEPDLDHIVII